MKRRHLALVAVSAAALAGCPNGADKPTSTASADPAASTTSTASAPSASNSAARPPPFWTKRPDLPAYAGPKATLKGVVTISGDKPPHTPFKYDRGCAAASGTYGLLFRMGLEGQLADAVVAVTRYEGYVPPSSEVVDITIHNCAYSTRTIALTDGQYIAVKNDDPPLSYLPHLDGARAPAINVTVPRGPKVKLYTRGRGRYWLRDMMGRKHMVAHVFHFPYSTAAVTGLDGRYTIEGIPVGKVQVSVMLPQTKTMKSKTVDLELKEGDNKLDLELVFDAAKDTPDDGHGGTKPK